MLDSYLHRPLFLKDNHCMACERVKETAVTDGFYLIIGPSQLHSVNRVIARPLVLKDKVWPGR